MGFHEVLFPVDVAYGSLGGPGFSTEIVETDSGKEQRIANWSQPRHRFNAAYAIRSYVQLQIVKTFYNARLGPANGFRFKDWFDFTTHVDGKSAHTNADAKIGDGNGTIKKFQLVKKYASGAQERFHKLRKPVLTTVLIAFDTGGGPVDQPVSGATWTFDSTTGLVTFTTAPPIGTTVYAGCQFDKPVRFGEDIDEALQAAYENFGQGSISDIPLIEIVDEEPFSDEFYYGGAKILTAMAASVSISELSGRLIILDPTVSGLSLFLPDFTNLPTGGPWFYLQNINSDSVSIRNSDDVEVGILDANSAMEIWLGLISSETKKWYGLT